MLDGIDGREVVRESALQGERKSPSYIDLQRTVMRAPESKSGEETRYIVDAKVRVGHVHLISFEGLQICSGSWIFIPACWR